MLIGTSHLDDLAIIGSDAITLGHLVRDQDLTSLPAHMPAEEGARLLRRRSFNWAPVTDVPIAAFVHRDDLAEDGSGRTVNECCQPIPDALRLPVETPLFDGLAHLQEHELAFVTYQRHVVGVITRADLQSSIVTLLAFGFITALESALDPLIQRYTSRSWQGKLPEGRMTGIYEVYEARRQRDSDISLMQCLNLDDRLVLVKKIPALRENLGFASTSRFKEWIKPLKNARNVLAHGGDLLDAFPDPLAAINFLDDIRVVCDRAWQVVAEDDHLLELQLRSHVDAVLDGGAVPLVGEHAVALPGETVHVLTAWDPGSVQRPTADNEAGNHELQRELDELGARTFPARGYSGEWSEDSIAVVGLSREPVLRLARDYGQVSIFELTDEELRVIRCADSAMIARPRRSS